MSRTILTVDDAATMRKLIALTLQEAGHDVLEAENGVAALEVLRQARVDLIISDINMPQMNGIELIRQVRTLDSCASVPILVLTTESEAQIKTQAKSAGATGWIVKPFQPSQLIDIVRKVLPA